MKAEGQHTKDKGGNKRELRKKVAVVTGASRGMGKAIAKRFAREEIAVVLAARNLTELEEVANNIRSLGNKDLLVLQTDVTKASDVQRSVNRTIEKFHRIDILVNNAGGIIEGLVKDFTEEQWDSVLNTNLKGVFLCSKAVLPHMIQQKRGVIVNISSVAGLTKGGKNHAVYCASKWGAMGFTRALNQEVREYGVRVCLVSPGGTDTSFLKDSRDREISSHFLTPSQVADAVLWIVRQPPNVIIDEVVITPLDLPW